MGFLQNGRWIDQWFDTKKTGGRFVRQDSAFRNWVTADGTPVDMDFEWRMIDSTLGAVDAGGLVIAAADIPSGHTRRTTVVVGGVHEGRLYTDFATVHVTRN